MMPSVCMHEHKEGDGRESALLFSQLFRYPSSWNSSVQFSSVAQSYLTLCDPMNHSMPGLPVHHKLPEFTQTHAHQVGDAIQPSHPLWSPSPPAHNPSQHQGLFQWVNSCMRWPKYWSFSFSISPSNEHPGLISFRMDWLDLPAVQGTLKSLLQHHSSKLIGTLKNSEIFSRHTIIKLSKIKDKENILKQEEKNL